MMKWEIIHVPAELPVPNRQSTVDVFASTLEPRLANTFVRLLNQVAPLENLRHVKRIRRSSFEGKVQLAVILCLALEQENHLAGLPNDMLELINAYQLQPFVTKVAKYAASSKEEWEEQCRLWPTSYHPCTNNMDGITAFSEEDSQAITNFMKAAIELSKSGHLGYQVVNATIIVDPSVKQVVASGCDQTCSWVTASNKCKSEETNCNERINSQMESNGTSHSNRKSDEREPSYTWVSCLHPWGWTWQRPNNLNSPVKPELNYSWHPLRHAALVAIECAAAWDRRLFPSLVPPKDQSIQKGDSDSISTSFSNKRLKFQFSQDVNGISSEVAHVSPTSELPSEATDVSRPYLCTGFDAFLTWEPCTMCAMALIHQRVRRIFYAFPNPGAGALGSIHRLQGEKSLNHHYSVFMVLVPEGILEKE